MQTTTWEPRSYIDPLTAARMMESNPKTPEERARLEEVFNSVREKNGYPKPKVPTWREIIAKLHPEEDS